MEICVSTILIQILIVAREGSIFLTQVLGGDRGLIFSVKQVNFGMLLSSIGRMLDF